MAASSWSPTACERPTPTIRIATHPTAFASQIATDLKAHGISESLAKKVKSAEKQKEAATAKKKPGRKAGTAKATEKPAASTNGASGSTGRTGLLGGVDGHDLGRGECCRIFSNLSPGLDDMKADDLIVWMKSGGSPESKSPGHIAVIYSVESSGLQCAESSGADDGQGHSGPRLSTKLLNNIASGGGKRWWDHSTGVIVVRPD